MSGGRYVVRAVAAAAAADHDVLFAAGSIGIGQFEPFPAKVDQVFSIQATDAHGARSPFNCVPWDGGRVYGTLGERVPVAERGPESTLSFRTGTAPATAIAAAIGAIIVGYINNFDTLNKWHLFRTQNKFRMLFLDAISSGL